MKKRKSTIITLFLIWSFTGFAQESPFDLSYLIGLQEGSTLFYHFFPRKDWKPEFVRRPGDNAMQRYAGPLKDEMVRLEGFGSKHIEYFMLSVIDADGNPIPERYHVAGLQLPTTLRACHEKYPEIFYHSNPKSSYYTYNFKSSFYNCTLTCHFETGVSGTKSRLIAVDVKVNNNHGEVKQSDIQQILQARHAFAATLLPANAPERIRKMVVDDEYHLCSIGKVSLKANEPLSMDMPDPVLPSSHTGFLIFISDKPTIPTINVKIGSSDGKWYGETDWLKSEMTTINENGKTIHLFPITGQDFIEHLLIPQLFADQDIDFDFYYLYSIERKNFPPQLYNNFAEFIMKEANPFDQGKAWSNHQRRTDPGSLLKREETKKSFAANEVLFGGIVTKTSAITLFALAEKAPRLQINFENVVSKEGNNAGSILLDENSPYYEKSFGLHRYDCSFILDQITYLEIKLLDPILGKDQMSYVIISNWYQSSHLETNLNLADNYTLRSENHAPDFQKYMEDYKQKIIASHDGVLLKITEDGKTISLESFLPELIGTLSRISEIETMVNALLLQSIEIDNETVKKFTDPNLRGNLLHRANVMRNVGAKCEPLLKSIDGEMSTISAMHGFMANCSDADDLYRLTMVEKYQELMATYKRMIAILWFKSSDLDNLTEYTFYAYTIQYIEQNQKLSRQLFSFTSEVRRRAQILKTCLR